MHKMSASNEMNLINRRIRRARSLWLPVVECAGMACSLLSVFFVAYMLSPIFSEYLSDKAMFVASYLLAMPLLTLAALVPMALAVRKVDQLRRAIRASQQDKSRLRLASRFMRR